MLKKNVTLFFWQKNVTLHCAIHKQQILLFSIMKCYSITKISDVTFRLEKHIKNIYIYIIKHKSKQIQRIYNYTTQKHQMLLFPS